MNALFASQRQDYTVDADGNVLDGAVLVTEPSTDLSCNAGYAFDAGSIQLVGKASNYYSGVTSGTLTIRVTP